MILAADIHLTDKPEDEYRWKFFDKLDEHADGEIFILGDLTDKADRHSGVLVNSLVSNLIELTERGNEITIIMGNHDKPLKGPSYFNFLSSIPKIKFISKPTPVGKLILLPYSSNPAEDWKGIPWERYQCAMIHQTVKGATMNTNMVADSDNLPPMPEDLVIYAGDLHIPHTIRNVTYVGAPHIIKFGDVYRCRFLKVDKDFQIDHEIILSRMQKKIIEISNPDQLYNCRINIGDQARVRFTLPSGSMDQWPVYQEDIKNWANQKGVTLASVEAVIETSAARPAIEQFDFDADPELVLKAFCKAEGVDGDLQEAGLKILKEKVIA